MDAHDHAITSLYKCAYFAGLIFVVHESTMKTAKIGPFKHFLLYGITLFNSTHPLTLFCLGVSEAFQPKPLWLSEPQAGTQDNGKDS